MSAKGWIVRQGKGTAGTLAACHVMPIDDLVHHPMSVRCWCHPTVNADKVRLLVTHNSKDGRELIERHGIQ